MIQAGQYYRNRIGEKIGPMLLSPEGQFFDQDGCKYDQNGLILGASVSPSNFDIVEEWSDEPPPQSVPRPCCETCKHWRRFSHVGQCRRYPPTGGAWSETSEGEYMR